MDKLSSLTINGLVITQSQKTMAEGAAEGLFKDERYLGDWSNRAITRPHSPLYVYYVGTEYIGMVDGEEAMFSTLKEWVESYAKELAQR